MVTGNMLGDKTGQGFFVKKKGEKGEKEIFSIDLTTFEYKPRSKSKFATVEAAKPIDDLKTRLKALCAGTDKAGEFYRLFHYGLFSYISHRIPEISDEIYRVDDAMMAGFGWEIGAFESWDVLGVESTVKKMKEAGYSIASWINDMLEAGIKSFYKVENGKRLYYDAASRSYKSLPGGDAFIVQGYCSHMLFPLAGGKVENCTLRCRYSLTYGSDVSMWAAVAGSFDQYASHCARAFSCARPAVASPLSCSAA
jgi:3-hydroxyacyl-CoA dehydrogenase